MIELIFYLNSNPHLYLLLNFYEPFVIRNMYIKIEERERRLIERMRVNTLHALPTRFTTRVQDSGVLESRVPVGCD